MTASYPLFQLVTS